jgi:ribosome biogenesis GTPase / thiamine phosphate phosphatase
VTPSQHRSAQKQNTPTPHRPGTTKPPAAQPPDAEADAAPALNPAPTDALHPGVVVRVDRATAVIENADGSGEPVRATWGGPLLAAIAEDPENTPTTGDRVRWRRWPDERLTVEHVEPRRTLLTRADADGGSKRQLLAANVDVVAVVEGLMPDPDERRIARLLTLAWASGAEPVVLLTKADLAPDGEHFATDLAKANACPVHPVSVVTGEGVAEVRALLEGRTTALLGASGAGKSSLVNAVSGQEVMRTQALRKDGKGRHTTVTRELHRVAGGLIIDGPGLRGVGITGSAGLDLTFADVVGLAELCRFADCSHSNEPGCAVLAAIDDGELPRHRLDAWRQLTAEGFRQELRRDARLRAEQNRKLRVQHRSQRRAYREKGQWGR